SFLGAIRPLELSCAGVSATSRGCFWLYATEATAHTLRREPKTNKRAVNRIVAPSFPSLNLLACSTVATALTRATVSRLGQLAIRPDAGLRYAAPEKPIIAARHRRVR